MIYIAPISRIESEALMPVVYHLWDLGGATAATRVVTGGM